MHAPTPLCDQITKPGTPKELLHTPTTAPVRLRGVLQLPAPQSAQLRKTWQRQSNK